MEKNERQLMLRNFNWRTYTMVFALVMIAIFFQITTNGIFLNSRNLSTLIRAMSITGVISLGTVLLIVSGNFDLSVGSIVGLSGGIAAILQVNFGASTAVAMLAALVVGILIGMWNGFWVAYRKVPSFIVTLGGMMVFRGIYLVLTDGITITPMRESFGYVSRNFVDPSIGMALGGVAIVCMALLLYSQRRSRAKYGFELKSMLNFVIKLLVAGVLIVVFVQAMNGYRGIPIPVLILVLLALVFMFISKRTRFGRTVYAIGGNAEAARLTGINIKKNVLFLYVITGFLSAISGILLTARLDGATAAAGTSFEMDVISACVIGGTSLSGGKGTIFGAVVGAMIIASLDNGMGLMNLSYNYQSIVKGLVLIMAVWFDTASQQRR